jgi:type VI secretion system protein ImpM
MLTPVTKALPLSAVGLVGKLPAQGDFVRVNASSPVVRAFEGWLHESVEAVRGAGLPLLRGPVHFLYRAAGLPDVLVGTLTPSHDRVGRAFPLAVFASIPAAAAARHLGVLPAACASFLAASQDLLEDAVRLSWATVTERLAALPAPDEVAAAEQALRVVLRCGQVGEWIARVYASDPVGQHLYGLATVLLACAPLKWRGADTTGATLDAPVRAASDRLVWLELLRRLLGWEEAPPALLWTDVPEPRLLVSLGPSPASMLRYLSEPAVESARLWPLTTRRADAIESARRALGSRHREALEGAHPLSLEALLEALVGR